VNASARRRALAGVLQRRGSVAVSELAAEFGCSEMTIRRDLDTLERDGVVRRTHGSAVLASLRADERPYPVRAFEASEAKERIGRAVAALIADGEAVALDAGTTTAEVGRALRGRPVTVMPLGIRTLVDLAYDERVRLIAPGGEIRAGELVVTGDLAEVAFERLRFDTFVLGACGIDARSGVTTHLPADGRVKRIAVASSARTIVVADRSKLGVVTFAHVCPLSATERLVTDAPPGDTANLEAPGFIIQRV
jgi:DeoR/GlpR family transcriptional regulator of sugar metabolism